MCLQLGHVPALPRKHAVLRFRDESVKSFGRVSAATVDNRYLSAQLVSLFLFLDIVFLTGFFYFLV